MWNVAPVIIDSEQYSRMILCLASHYDFMISWDGLPSSLKELIEFEVIITLSYRRTKIPNKNFNSKCDMKIKLCFSLNPIVLTCMDSNWETRLKLGCLDYWWGDDRVYSIISWSTR